MTNERNQIFKKILLNSKEFAQIQETGRAYAHEANRCGSSNLHPSLSGCYSVASAIHTTLLLTVNLRAMAINNIEILPRENEDGPVMRLCNWDLAQTVRVTEYMRWFPRALTGSEQAKYHITESAISITRLCHMHDLLKPGVSMYGVIDVSKGNTKLGKSIWRDELSLWLRVNKFLLDDIQQELMAWRNGGRNSGRSGQWLEVAPPNLFV